MAWSPNGRFLAVGGARRITVFDAETGYKISELSIDLTSWVEALLWAPDNQFLVSSSQEGKIQIWNVEQGHQLNQIAANSTSDTIAWLPDGRTLVAGQNDGLIKLWDVHLGRSIAELESHSGRVHCVDVSYNGSLLASKSDDNTVRLWDARTFGTLATIREDGAGNELAHRFLSGIAFHPSAPILATLGNRGEAVRLWDYDEALLLGQEADSITYTTAKLVLVGDSGVGKTGLGWRLAHGEFKAQSSTHGQQFWVIPQLGKKRNDGAECEAVLWDLAGQHVYRQVHSIFLEDVAVALVVFDPSNRQDPLKGVEFWLEQLKGRSQLPPAVLVGARTDRGAPTLPQEDLDQFCTKNHIRGGYISTSALSGAGLDALLERVTAQIPWDQMTATITTVTFKRIKDYVLRLKETANHRSTLVTPAELRRKMEAPNLHRRLQSDVVAVGNFSTAGRPFKFTDAEMMTAVGHLQNHGYVTVLEGSSGEEHVLLKPELLVNTAASIMLVADKNVRELGAVSEAELLSDKFPFEELEGLEELDRHVLLDSAIGRFLAHNVCFRETFASETLLIFPSLIKQKRPLADDCGAVDDVSYIVRGRVENIYASMVVLLGYSSTFTRINQWRSQAQYEIGPGETCGFRLIEEREGELELVLYFSAVIPDYGRSLFRGLFEKFLYQRDVEVVRIPPVSCRNGHRIERVTVIKRARERKSFTFCGECGEKTELPELEQPQILGTRIGHVVQRAEAQAHLRSLYETNLTRIKSYRRDRVSPRCHIDHQYADADWAEKFAHDLRDAGISTLPSAGDLRAGDFLLVVCSPGSKAHWRNSVSNHEGLPKSLEKVILIVLGGQPHDVIPSELRGFHFIDFRDELDFCTLLRAGGVTVAEGAGT